MSTVSRRSPDAVTGWRLLKTRHAASAFDGEGARRYGGRWSSPGVAVTYLSESVALATLEVLAHLQVTELLPSYSLVSVAIPRALIMELDLAVLPRKWREFPPSPSVQAIGDAWVAAGSSAVLKVPSVLVPDSFNYIINPAHAGAKRLRYGEAAEFRWDERLMLRSSPR